MAFQSTILPTSKDYDVTEMQLVVSDLLSKINVLAGQLATLQKQKATVSTLGMVKVGTGLTISSDGTISVY